MEPLTLKLYTKPDCPLCDDAKDLLNAVAADSQIQIEEIDITSNLGLFTKYKDTIPVLEMNGKRMFEHRIDVRVLKRKLKWRRLYRKFVESL
ncbi:MAG: glutaredoxin family protein [Candidatus Poribacteria bacterium]|nr:glutaredoxin family protein [Candidatus Poribacteria bacterium]